MNTGPELRTLDLRHYLRRLRNLLAALLMLGAFLQGFGVPRVTLSRETQSLRLSPPETPVWEHARRAGASAWSRLVQEIRP